MKPLNFRVSLKNFFIVCIIFAISICSIIISLSPILMSNADGIIEQKLLIIVENDIDKQELSASKSNFIEYKSLDDLDNTDKTYIAYAVSKEIAQNPEVNELIRSAFYNNSARVYIYENITLSNYKSIMGLNSYAIETDILQDDGSISGKAMMSFGGNQENNKVEQIISYSAKDTSDNLIVSAAISDKKGLENIIIDHFCEIFMSHRLRTTLVKNGFGYRTYPVFSGSTLVTTAYLNVDYFLYKSDDEAIAEYDYFALKINANPVYTGDASFGKLQCTELQIKQYLPYSNDHLCDYAPAANGRTSSINASLGFGASGVSGSIGFSYDLSSSPDLQTSFNTATRTVSWKASRFWFFGKELNNDLFSFGASWASTGSVAVAQISSYVVFGGSKSNWETLEVRYSY